MYYCTTRTLETVCKDLSLRRACVRADKAALIFFISGSLPPLSQGVIIFSSACASSDRKAISSLIFSSELLPSPSSRFTSLYIASHHSSPLVFLPFGNNPIMKSVQSVALLLFFCQAINGLVTPNHYRHLAKSPAFPPKTTLATNDAALNAAEMPRGGDGTGTGTATIPNEVFNLIKSIVGAGVLSLPAGTRRQTTS